MNINIVTQEDLMVFKKELVKELSDLIENANFNRDPRKWLKTWEVMKMLNISKGKLQALRNSGEITFSRIGKSIYYKQEEINKLFDENTIKNKPGPGRGTNRYSMKNES